MKSRKRMNDDVSMLFQIFKNAIDAERDSQVNYETAMNLCSDPELKEVLKGFCEDEARHEQELLKRYKELRIEYGMK